MGNELAKLSDYGKSALRIAKSVGPLLISQSERASEAYAQHQMRLAQVEATKEFMLAEAKSLAEARAQLREQYFSADEVDRIGIRRDIEESEREIRRLNIVSAALEKLPPKPDESPEVEVDPSEVAISEHWLDKFNEFAKAKNEPWRQDLLSAALAMEAQKAGSVGPRALWTIGTMDEYLFHAFASLLDVSATVGGGHIVPKHGSFNDRPVPECVLGKDTAIGNLTFMLGDIGLIGDVMTSQKVFREGARVLARYGRRQVGLTVKKQIKIGGIIPTKLGETLAQLYQSKSNLLGQEILEKWISALKEEEVEVEQLA